MSVITTNQFRIEEDAFMVYWLGSSTPRVTRLGMFLRRWQRGRYI